MYKIEPMVKETTLLSTSRHDIVKTYQYQGLLMYLQDAYCCMIFVSILPKNRELDSHFLVGHAANDGRSVLSNSMYIHSQPESLPDNVQSFYGDGNVQSFYGDQPYPAGFRLRAIHSLLQE